MDTCKSRTAIAVLLALWIKETNREQRDGGNILYFLFLSRLFFRRLVFLLTYFLPYRLHDILESQASAKHRTTFSFSKKLEMILKFNQSS